jgi:RNA polymerase sigma-70 factor, ECF subfamily
MCSNSGMDFVPPNSSDETVLLIERARSGDASALDELFTLYRERLRRMVQMRLDWRLHGRIDESDVVQDAYCEAARRLSEYLAQPEMPLFLWL